MPNKPPTDSTPWRLEDVIDFDYAVERTFESSLESDSARRKIFLEFLAERGLADSDSIDRQEAFRFWLETQRRQAPPSMLWPGTLFCQGKRLLAGGLMLVALLAGILASTGLLRYDGTQPVNVFGFLFFLLGGQLLLLAASIGTLLLRPLGLLGLETGAIAPGICRLLRWMAARIQREALNHSSSEAQLRLAAFLGSLEKKNSRYQPLLVGIVASLAQTFGVWFNIAAAATALLLLAFSDRAFGWQSSFDLPPENVHQAVHVIALPWASFYPEGAPSVSQIEGSRIHLKDGIRSLATANLVSWGPFLVCSLLVYGLLPRLLLWLAAWWIVRRQLRKLRFHSLRCDRLWNSMVRRQLQIPAEEPNAAPPPAHSETLPETSPLLRSANSQTALLIVEPELSKRIHHTAIDESIHRQLHWTINKWIPLPDETESWDDFWTALEPMQNQDAYARIAVLQEGFQPPIREFLDWLKKLKKSQGAGGKIIVFLVGRPKDAGQTGPVSETNHRIWLQSAEALGEANLAVTALAIHNDADE